MVDHNQKINIYCNAFSLPWPSSGNIKYKTPGGLMATVGLGNKNEISLSH